MVVARAEHATLQKLFPMRMAVINLDGSSSKRSTSSVCFGLSFSNNPFRRIRLIAVNAVSVDEKRPDSNKKKKGQDLIYTNFQ